MCSSEDKAAPPGTEDGTEVVGRVDIHPTTPVIPTDIPTTPAEGEQRTSVQSHRICPTPQTAITEAPNPCCHGASSPGEEQAGRIDIPE